MRQCKVCGTEISRPPFGELSPEGDSLYVVIVGDKAPVILRSGDSLCTQCNHDAIWYKKID